MKNTSQLIGYRKMHYISGATITLFIVIHLINQAISTYGPQAHIELMHTFRTVYRNPVIETILLMAIVIQIRSGIYLIRYRDKKLRFSFETLRIYSGIYLALFFIFHLFAVFAGRIMGMDTNYYFAAAGLNTWPFSLYYIPYYALSIISFFGHIAGIHHMKMTNSILGIPPRLQSTLILSIGIILASLIIYGMTNHFRGIVIPKEYQILIGK